MSSHCISNEVQSLQCGLQALWIGTQPVFPAYHIHFLPCFLGSSHTKLFFPPPSLGPGAVCPLAWKALLPGSGSHSTSLGPFPASLSKAFPNPSHRPVILYLLTVFSLQHLPSSFVVVVVVFYFLYFFLSPLNSVSGILLFCTVLWFLSYNHAWYSRIFMEQKNEGIHF